MEAEQVRARELELEQEFNLRLERAVQERVQERERRAAQETSPERRSAGRQDDGDDEVEGEGRLPRNDREELQRRADALENWEQDPNSSVLLDPAAERGWLC